MDGIPPLSCPWSLWCRILTGSVLTACVLLLLRAFVVEPFQIPTGSMAPTLLGHHRTAVCPRCGFIVDVGRCPTDRNSTGGEHYSQASCPNCGCRDLPLGRMPETPGDQVLVNKSLFALRAPRRWEVVVFRMFGKIFIKRLIGLGGEEIEIVDGDVHVNGKLVRKTWDEFLGMRVLVFDNDFAPQPNGWKDRWEFEPDSAFVMDPRQPLTLDGRARGQQVTYRHFSLDERKCTPITDEYAYNGDKPRGGEAVHDFMVQMDLEVVEGRGNIVLSLTDGDVDAEAEVAVGGTALAQVRINAALVASGRKLCLEAGKRYHIEMALVDRRLTVRLDGCEVFTPLDLPEATARVGVMRPLRITANGVLARLRQVRLFRDVHYAQLGTNAVHGRALRLGIDQTFVLGDNSLNSDDSRFWPEQGKVPVQNLLGRAFLVHLPSRTALWQGWGHEWRYQLPAWDRVRWIR